MRARLVVCVASFLAAPAAAQESEKDFRWSQPLAAGQILEVKGVNSGINATAAAGRAAVVTGVKRWRRGDPATIDIKVVEHARGVTICVVRVDRGGQCEPGESGRHGGDGRHRWVNDDNNDVSVEFTVTVPVGVAFQGRTVNGGIRATGLSSDVVASTVNGGVDISTTGTAAGSTVNGNLHVAMGAASWNGRQRYTTVNGSVILELPATADFDLEATTINGGIRSEFPITVQGKITPKRLIGTVGKGGRTLTANTVNGGIEIRKAS